ncbi:MAG: dihydrolipoamide dehydrogenase [Pisciglobus halotolerans]|nr:dihydrolipoamide dehydrogenase [Pisciglobus halotolerans]
MIKESTKATAWIGLKPSRFRKYKTWVNRIKPGICGTYVSAVLLHDAFLQYYHIDLAKEKVVAGLKGIVDERFAYRGTFIWDLKSGLNYVLKDNKEIKAKLSLFPQKTVRHLLNQPNPKPVAVGTTRLFGSPYKNHWVVVYAYRFNEEGELEFKVYDNHGRYRTVIPASETIGCVWLEYS